MLMDELLSGRFDNYFRDAALGDEMCVFAHVPKTAGTSLRGEIAKLLQPDVNIAVDYTDHARSFHERMDEAVAHFIAEASDRKIRFASGHILGRHIVQIRAAFPTARFVTFLRDPVHRVISDYRYQRSPRHPVHEQFIAEVPDLDAYLAIRTERNKIAQHLVAPDVLRGGDHAECIEYITRTYGFVGMQEMYPISFRTLTALIGAPSWPKLRENVNSDDDAERQVSPAIAERIRAANSLDVAIYDAFFSRWQQVRETLAGRLG